jgi:hypothetical protein
VTNVPRERGRIGRSPRGTDPCQLTSVKPRGDPISWLSTAAFSHPSQDDAPEFLRPIPKRPPRPERLCRRCGNGRHVQRKPPHDRLRRQSRPTNKSRSAMPRPVHVPDRRRDRRELRSPGTSRSVVGQRLRPAGCRQQGRSHQTELSSWTRHAGRSAPPAGRQPRSAPTRRLSASRRPVSMNAIVKTSDAASPVWRAGQLQLPFAYWPRRASVGRSISRDEDCLKLLSMRARSMRHLAHPAHPCDARRVQVRIW